MDGSPIDSLTAAYDSPYGTVSVAWARSASRGAKAADAGLHDRLSVRVSVPPNLQARVRAPRISAAPQRIARVLESRVAQAALEVGADGVERELTVEANQEVSEGVYELSTSAEDSSAFMLLASGDYSFELEYEML